MPISGVLAVCRPEQQAAVSRRIEENEWAEVHFTAPDGRLVVTIDGETTDLVMDRLLELQKLPGVIMAAMAEHYVEDEARPDSGDVPSDMDGMDPTPTGELR